MAEKMPEDEVRSRLVRQPGWEGDGNSTISRSFTFTDHIAAVGFVVRVAMVAEVMNHHPDLHMVYNRVDITLSTHDAGGVTENDFELAERISAMIGMG
jgi:4a-hydroxytetrahydrobiopterin dehydratase